MTTTVTRALFDTERRHLSFKEIAVDELEASLAHLQAKRGFGVYTVDHDPDGISAESLNVLTGSLQELIEPGVESLVVNYILESHLNKPDEANGLNFLLTDHRATFVDVGNAPNPVVATIHEAFLKPPSLRQSAAWPRVVVELTTPKTRTKSDFVLEVKKAFNALRETYQGTKKRSVRILEGTWDAPAKIEIPTTTEDIRRELLSRGWPSSKRVGEMLGSAADSNPAQHAARLRKKGQLFGVWSVQDSTYVHPDFQFLDGHLSPHVKSLLTELERQRSFSASEDPSGWRRAFWLYGASQALSARALSPSDGKASDTPRTPAEVFASHPKAVIDLARTEAESEADPDANW